jgi:hypothetical protein
MYVRLSVFCVLFVCKCVLYCYHRVSTQCVLYCCHRVSTQLRLKIKTNKNNNPACISQNNLLSGATAEIRKQSASGCVNMRMCRCVSNFGNAFSVLGTGWSKSLCAPDDYNTESYMFKLSPASLQTFIDTRLTLTPSVIHNSNYVIMVSDLKCWKYLCVFVL